jgi:hypothetical protein
MNKKYITANIISSSFNLKWLCLYLVLIKYDNRNEVPNKNFINSYDNNIVLIILNFLAARILKYYDALYPNTPFKNHKIITNILRANNTYTIGSFFINLWKCFLLWW